MGGRGRGAGGLAGGGWDGGGEGGGGGEERSGLRRTRLLGIRIHSRINFVCVGEICWQRLSQTVLYAISQSLSWWVQQSFQSKLANKRRLHQQSKPISFSVGSTAKLTESHSVPSDSAHSLQSLRSMTTALCLCPSYSYQNVEMTHTVVYLCACKINPKIETLGLHVHRNH